MTLQEIFSETKLGRLYRFLHFPRPPSEWTLDMEVLVEEPDPNEPDHAPLPQTRTGYYTSVFSSDIEHIVNYVDKVSMTTDDEVRLDALRYYYHHGGLVFDNWKPSRKSQT